MNATRPTAVIIMAAGEGTRMKSATPKVMHRIGGRTLLEHAMACARAAEPELLAVVVRHQRDRVAAHVAALDADAIIADQDEVKGTGRAVECGLDALPPDLTGTVLVTSGDVPLLAADTLTSLVEQHGAGGCAVTVVTARVADPTGYGRIVREADGSVAGIVEHKDATDEQRGIDEINSGIYAFDIAVLREALARVGTDNTQGEKYLTDVLATARAGGGRCAAYVCDDLWQVEGVNDRVQLAALGRELNRRICERHMRAGVTIVDPDTTWVDADVSIGADSMILPSTQLVGATSIGAGAVVGPAVTLTDCEVGERARIRRTEANLAVVGADAEVGPYCSLRAGTTVGAGATVHAFVEARATTVPDGGELTRHTGPTDGDGTQEADR